MNWCTFGIRLTRPSLTSGVDIAHVCKHKADTRSNYFDTRTRAISVFVKCDTIFKFFLVITTNLNKVARQHTEGMVGSMGFVRNLLLFLAVKKFWKFVKNWQSYCHEFGVLLFWCHSVESKYSILYNLNTTDTVRENIQQTEVDSCTSNNKC